MAYIGKSPTGSGVRQRYVYTATGGETSLSGADDNGKTLVFTDGEYVDVYLNGVLLVQGSDYGVGTTNTISGLTALTAGQVVEIIVYDIYSVAKINSEAIRYRYYKTATGGETSISGTDDSGATITFPANAQIDVYLNGISLVAGTDYNTTTANTVGGLAALSSGDIVEIIYYTKFVLSDTVSKANGGTFSGSINISGNLIVTGNSVTLPADSKAEFDMWRNTANVSSIGSSGTVISGNWERVDEPSSPSSPALGTGMSVDANGIWTFPSTGIWLITYHTRFFADGTAQLWAGGVISVTQDNSSYNQATEPYINLYTTNAFGSTVCEHLMNVTDTANDKVKLSAKGASSPMVSGHSNENQTYVRFWRIADKQ